MADYYNSFATFIPCDDEADANAMLASINSAFTDDMMDPDNEYVPEFEYCYTEKSGDTWGVFMADEFNGMNEPVAEAIRAHLEAKNSDARIVITGNFGCSKLRAHEFGGWAVGIKRDAVEWIDAGSYMQEFINR
jgi:hypothetical protein